MFELFKSRINRGNLWGNIVWGIFGIIFVIFMARYMVMWGKAANPDYSILRLAPDYDYIYLSGDTLYLGFAIDNMKMPNPGVMYISIEMLGTDILFERNGYAFYYDQRNEPISLFYEYFIKRRQQKLVTEEMVGLRSEILEYGSGPIHAYQDSIVIPYTISFGEMKIEDSLSVYIDSIRPE